MMERRVRGNSHARCEAGEKVEAVLAHRSDLTYRYHGVPVIWHSEKAALSVREIRTKKFMCSAM